MNYKWQITRTIDNQTVVEYVIKDNPNFTHEDWMGEQGLYTYEVIDITNDVSETAKIKWEEACLDGGYKAKARFNRMLRKYGYGLPEQSYFMESADFGTIDYLLGHGAIDQCIALLNAKTEEGAYTHEFKNEFLAILTEISTQIGNEPS